MDQDHLLAGAGVLLCIYAALKISKKRRVRRYKVRPLNRDRKQTGGFQYYLKMKKLDPEQFFIYTRMNKAALEKLLNYIRPTIIRDKRSDCISPEERLIITLQYLSQGSSMQSLAWTFNIGITTVHKIIYEVCEAIWENLSEIYLKTPDTEQEWKKISDGFYNRWNFPNCLGAIDGKHINMRAPDNSESLYFNYKKTFNIVLLATCDSKYKFTFVDIGSYGSQSDGSILKNSSFGQALEKRTLNLPCPYYLPNSLVKLPFYFVGDEAFPLRSYIMRPYPGKNLSEEKKIFNYRLSRARQMIENSFGVLSSRWRILLTTINAYVENVDKIVKTVTVLHNYCQIELPKIYCPKGYTDNGDVQGLWRQEIEPLVSVSAVSSNFSARENYLLRDTLCAYLNSPQGQVSWQNNMVTRHLLR